MTYVKYLSVLFFVFLLGCPRIVPPSRIGPKAQYYFIKSEPIIKALSEYFNKNNSYPTRLDELKPVYLSSFDWSVRNYRLGGGSYDLWFDYRDNGIKRCVYKPQNKWKCV